MNATRPVLLETQAGELLNFIISGAEVDIITGTLGKAFGGAIGGFTTGGKGDY